MNELKLNDIMYDMAQNYGIFCSEADFQFCLAQKLKEYYPEFHFWLEYPIKDIKDKKIYVDIFMTNQNEEYYIELKYKTKKLVYDAYKQDLKVEKRTLENQGAQSIGALLYHQDIERLEKITDISKKCCVGYAIFLTNDSIYYNKEISSKKIKNPKYTGCYFRDGIIAKEANYPAKNKDKTMGNGNCKLRNEYLCTWLDYKHQNYTPENGCKDFKYIITEVKKADIL